MTEEEIKQKFAETYPDLMRGDTPLSPYFDIWCYAIEIMEEQIEKMKCCENCKYGYCDWGSESIIDGKRQCHAWNKEKEEYCDIGYQGKYQCWQLKE